MDIFLASKTTPASRCAMDLFNFFGHVFAGLSVHVAAFPVDLLLTHPSAILAAVDAPLSPATPASSHKQPPLAVFRLSIASDER